MFNFGFRVLDFRVLDFWFSVLYPGFGSCNIAFLNW